MRVLRPERMLDGNGSALAAGSALLLDGDRIAAILPPGAVVPAGAIELALPPDCTLLPGLIDLHDYLSVDPDRPDPMRQMFSSDVALRRSVAQRHLRRDLLSGVTTQRIMGEGGGLDRVIAAELRAGALAGPMLVLSGAPIAPTGSHQQRPTGGLDSEAALLGAVEDAVAAGQGWIKLVATGGVNGSGIGPTDCAYAPKLLRRATEAAHAAGLRVAVAAQGGPAVRAAADAGAETLEHGALLDADDVAALAANGMAWVVTPGRFLRADGIPLAAARNPEVARRLSRVRAALASAVPLAVRLGVRLGLGADNMHGRFGDDVGQLAALGAPAATAIAAATGNGAAVLGLSDRGWLHPGLRADLLLVDGDPLLAPDALQRVRGVFNGGRYYTLAELA
ncbi:amidohydrolase family protein [Neoroseomonas lacus]|uniref:Xaa-Pro dipeptidase n=1 Tax=Neoroseomonas lacus TaxID=287609 RepID=A0A917KPA5_9PROT|nr:amidohydrolase family protein [Neoroseomonas lacus]GGJ23529.1 Xaa-Pro dipeptidase [Neoroseomonas lacus]